MTEQQPERRWVSGLAGYAPPASDLKDAFATAHIPTRWLALTEDEQGRLVLGPLRPPVVIDARVLTNEQIIAVFADLIRRSLAPAFVLLYESQRAARQIAVACAPIAVIAASPPPLVDWLLLSRLALQHLPRHQIWLGQDAPIVWVRDRGRSLILILDALLGGTPPPLVCTQIQRSERVVAQGLAEIRQLAQIPLNRREAPSAHVQRLMTALDMRSVLPPPSING